jgi:hypothetical protein
METFLTPAQLVVERSASGPSQFTPGKIAAGTKWKAKCARDVVVRRKMRASAGNETLVVQPVT